MTRFTLLCQLNGGCMGCCGRDFISKEKIKEAIKENTEEFKAANPLVKAQLMKFRDRAHPQDLRLGVCRNLVELEGKILCPLHPSLHQNVDLRVNHCDIDFMCRTAVIFETWDAEKKKKFIEFIERKKMDNLDFSLMIDKGTLLDEFEAGKRQG